jgi:TolA-binding protein
VDELKARLAKISKHLDDMQTAQQNISAPPAGGQPGANPGAANNVPQAPPADQLYNDGLRDYNANKNDLASQQFAQYLQVYGNTDLAGNAQFYLGRNCLSPAFIGVDSKILKMRRLSPTSV